MIRATILFVALPVVVLGLGIAVVAGTMVTNNLRLSDWKRDLYQVTPPEPARIVARGTEFGLLGGNGNHGDKRAWVRLATSAPADEIERYYADHLKSAAGRVSVFVEDVTHVRVEMSEQGEAAGWDPRCH